MFNKFCEIFIEGTSRRFSSVIFFSKLTVSISVVFFRRTLFTFGMIQNAVEENNMDKATVYKWSKREIMCWQNEEMSEQKKPTKTHKQSTQLKVSETKFASFLVDDYWLVWHLLWWCIQNLRKMDNICSKEVLGKNTFESKYYISCSKIFTIFVTYCFKFIASLYKLHLILYLDSFKKVYFFCVSD